MDSPAQAMAEMHHTVHGELEAFQATLAQLSGVFVFIAIDFLESFIFSQNDCSARLYITFYYYYYF